MMELYETIRKMPMFENFTEEEIKQFARMEHFVRRFKQGDIIMKEGQTYSSLYLLFKGTILATRTKNNIPVAKLDAGAVFGEMSFSTFPTKSRHTTMIANGDVLVIKMYDAFFRDIDPMVKDKIKNYLIKLLLLRLDKLKGAIADISEITGIDTLKLIDERTQ